MKEIIAFVGKCNRFDEWFKTWGEYEEHVHGHNNILKLFNEDGSHYEVPVGAWIVKTPDGHNVPATFTFKQKSEWSEEDESVLSSAEGWLDTLCDYLRDSSPNEVDEVKNIIFKLKSLRHQKQWKPTEEQKTVEGENKKKDCTRCSLPLDEKQAGELPIIKADKQSIGDSNGLEQHVCEEHKEKFQVGDRVKIHCNANREYAEIYDGKIGKITEIWDLKRNKCGIIVILENGCNDVFSESELELVENE